MKEKQKEIRNKNLNLSSYRDSSIYKNMLPSKIWNKCEKIYEKYKNKYNDLMLYKKIKLKEIKKQNSSYAA